MDRLLIDYRPELESSSAADAAAWRQAEQEMTQAAALLEALQAGRLPAFLRQLVRQAALPGPMSSILLDALRQLAQRLLAPAALAQPKVPARVFGMELEGLSAEDKEFELARHFLRFSSHALRRARQLQRGDPRQRARLALALAARRHAPGLVAVTDSLRAAPPSRHLLSDLKRELTMHDIDRTTLEFNNESGYEAEFEFGQGEWEAGATLSEAEEMELASELLAVNNEEELEQFLGGLIRKVASGASSLIKSPAGKMLGGLLKGVAKKALPLAGGALGGVIGGPLGAKIGSGLASAAGSALGLEAEYEMNSEDREFEGARTFVKLATDTINRVAQSPGGDPRQAAMQAATAAARRYAPGLLTQQGGGARGRSGAGQGAGMGQGATARGGSGRWVRQGRKIVLYGA
ncbi:uncharacterized protein (DUF697 family) [Duganella sp. 1224]|uniref:hypothetical protein n=1 Tax=Duganella sp. 1224 TaxID=2587052 RepID=UPI00184ACE74|nr:hypothetical protein [Duganella sp. 1224]NYE60373.1 uncharacterized protein (DUF697 family) [Duganella sp. 1224]